MKINWSPHKPKLSLFYNPKYEYLEIQGDKLDIIGIIAMKEDFGQILRKVDNITFYGYNLTKDLEFEIEYHFGTVYYKYSDFTIVNTSFL